MNLQNTLKRFWFMLLEDIRSCITLIGAIAISLAIIIPIISILQYLTQGKDVEELMRTTDSIRKYELIKTIVPFIGKPSPKVILAVAKTLNDNTLIQVKSAAGSFVTSSAKEALEVLKLMGDNAIEQLILALDDPNFQQIAASALRELTGQDFGVDRKAWQEWWKE